jgi:hypothetical protein
MKIDGTLLGEGLKVLQSLTSLIGKLSQCE